jgi:predicted molibdopterin-dependent oxidoreductase YjgC
VTDPIRFTLDGREVEAMPGESVWQVAKRLGTDIPHLCWLPEPGYRADGNCRACMVEVEGERVLAASCIRKPQAGMKVRTASDRAVKARRMVMELLLADQPAKADAHDKTSRLWDWAERMGVEESRFPMREQPAPDWSHPRWRSTSTPASSARCACAPAARSRSTTSSAWPSAATPSGPCSTRTTRWGPPPASPAASASRPARPGR